MKVILLKDVKSVGRRFEEKNVSDGFAINFLIPKKLAVIVGSAAAREVKSQIQKEAQGKAQNQEKISENISKLSGTEIAISLKANEKGHLFASLSKEKITELLKDKGIEIDPDSIALPEPIKETGTFSVPVSVGDKQTHFTLLVTRA